MKRIILCADDYGQNFAISQAILNLLEKGRLTATSCLVTSSEWPLFSDYLKPFKDKIEVGLHFNLTEGTPLSYEFIKKYGLSFFTLPKLLARSFLHLLDKKCLEAELTAQLDKFERYFGKLPDFVDGHHHVHQLPLVRDIIIKTWQQRLKPDAYIRHTFQGEGKFQPHKGWFKRLIIRACGGRTFKKRLNQLNVPHNPSFSGVYNFTNEEEYSRLFPLFLQQIGEGGIIMCHPGLEVKEDTDPIALARYREYQYFMSDQFVLDCQKFGVSCSASRYC
jgi:chitin disaccharide deacetylase